MTGFYIVLISLAVALCIGFAASSPVIWALHVLDRSLKRRTLVPTDTVPPETISVINLQVSASPRPSFAFGPQLILAAALTVTVVSIPISTIPPVAYINA